MSGAVTSGPRISGPGISGPAANSPVMNANGDADAAAGRAAVGATPLRAAQLLAAAPPGGVFVCATTRELVGALFEARSVAPSAGVNGAWQVLAEAAVDSRFEALRRSSRPLLGRDEELALLLRRWQQVGSGAGRVVLVCGEAGIGKSRLVAGLREALADSQPACWRYACAPHRQQTALYPVVVQLEHRAGFTREDDDRTRLQKLERMLAPAPARPRDARARRRTAGRPAGRRCGARARTQRPAPPRAAARLPARAGRRRSRPRAAVADSRGRALDRPDDTRALRPHRRAPAQPAGAARHDLPAGVRRALGRAVARDAARPQPARCARQRRARAPGRGRPDACPRDSSSRSWRAATACRCSSRS